MSGRRTPLLGRIGRADRRSAGFSAERYCRGRSDLGLRFGAFDELKIRCVTQRAIVMFDVRQNPAMDLRKGQLRP